MRRRASLPPQHVAGSGTWPGLLGWTSPAPHHLLSSFLHSTTASKHASPSPSPSQGKEQLLEGCCPSAGALQEAAWSRMLQVSRLRAVGMAGTGVSG